MFLRSGYNYDADAVSRETAVEAGDEVGAQQQFKDEVDINTIVRRFGLTGQLPEDIRFPQSGDFTAAQDFHSCMNVVREAEEEFMRLPAETRRRFNNDPGVLLAFLEDGANRDEAVRLGLVNPPPEVSRSDPPKSGV